MFKKSSKQEEITDEVETIIGPSVKIEGDFSSNGNVLVAGIVSGKLSTSQNLRVEEKAKISADIKAREAVIAGDVNGNIKVEGHLEILSTAKINGEIKTGSIAIQQGAFLNGNCIMGESVPADSPKEPVKEEESF
jgi:cytoskeletal protein CcmA (bactofilin family)